MGKVFELSDCELMTMKCIWDSDHPVTCAEIMEKLKRDYGLEYKDTTVYTFLKKLKEKGFVDSFRKGITFFIPLRDEASYRNEQMKFARDFWFNGSVSSLVSNLFQIKEVDKKELDEIKKLIDDMD